MLAGLSDVADGYIARRFDQQSVLGSILDPLADKALVAAVALPLALTGALQPWLVALMVTRDVGLVVGVLVMRSGLTPASGVTRKEALQRVRASAKNIKSLEDLKKEAAIDPAAPFESFEINPTLLSKVRLDSPSLSSARLSHASAARRTPPCRSRSSPRRSSPSCTR